MIHEHFKKMADDLQKLIDEPVPDYIGINKLLPHKLNVKCECGDTHIEINKWKKEEAYEANSN